MNFNYHINLIKLRLVQEYPNLGKHLRPNYGLLEQEEDERDYIMGASDDKLPWKVIKEDSDWTNEAKRMIHEVQRSGMLETMNCTKFALNNILEMIHLAKWNEIVNYSDRFPGSLQGTTRRGNTFNRQLSNIKKYGCVKEEDFPWDRGKFRWNDYYSLPSLQVKDKGQQWLKDYLFGWDGVWANKTMMIEALKYSPLYVGVYAWYKKGALYYSRGNPNHASVIVKRDKFLDYDSYKPHIKQLDDNFEVYYVKRIFLNRKEDIYNTDELRLLEKDGCKFVARPDHKGEFYKIKDGTLEYIPNLRDIADDLTKYMKTSPQNLNEVLKFLTDKKHIKWLSEKAYYNLKK